VSYAAEHPVPCARHGDLGCKASHPSSRWDAMKADRDGWFHSYQEECAYCPAHVPEWVPAWRAKRAAALHKVRKSVTGLPSEVRCSGCDLSLSEKPVDADAEAELRDLVWQHARSTGHKITLTTTREMTVEPADE
jgi:hypothetical protein